MTSRSALQVNNLIQNCVQVFVCSDSLDFLLFVPSCSVIGDFVGLACFSPKAASWFFPGSRRIQQSIDLIRLHVFFIFNFNHLIILMAKHICASNSIRASERTLGSFMNKKRIKNIAIENAQG